MEQLNYWAPELLALAHFKRKSQHRWKQMRKMLHVSDGMFSRSPAIMQVRLVGRRKTVWLEPWLAIVSCIMRLMTVPSAQKMCDNSHTYKDSRNGLLFSVCFFYFFCCLIVLNIINFSCCHHDCNCSFFWNVERIRMDQWSRIQGQETNPHRHVFFNKSAKINIGWKMASSVNKVVGKQNFLFTSFLAEK